jgi:hypothetical protein
MIKEEILKIALARLEYWYDYADCLDDGQAITAIKEALAQPEQDPCCYGGIAHDCHAGQGCRIAERLKAAQKPPQRTWVGLTDEEYAKLAEEFGPFPINQIEAKLKGKNI